MYLRSHSVLPNFVRDQANHSDKILATRLKDRDREAVGLLYDRYSRPLFGIIYRIVRSQEIAEDVLQETFVRLWERIDQFDIERGTLFTWINTIARNLALDTVKSKAYKTSNKNQTVGEVVDVIDRDQSVSYNPETIGVQESVARLEPELRKVVETLYFRGYSQSEAAEELNLPLGTLKTRARKAISLLRSMFNDVEEQPGGG
ncbi:MAG: RNA polymerase sigma factor [Candidatus Kapaibacterium sp.]